LGGSSVFSISNPIIYLAKIIFCVFLISVIRSGFARLRIDQVLSGLWKYLTPLALLQIFLIELM
jgi:NADH:ubiquinone oxidoreductase subunit H